ncbi:OmpA family protein [Sphingomonas sp.]|uniref:OmpA family protein n=1 Tax=Sphingomonas sp. TaxID=28214 RepID=UPI003CC55F22
MRYGLVAMGLAGLLTSTSALAQQQTAQPAGSDMAGYLCTFGGQCGTAAAQPEQEPTRAMPETKGFRIAAANQAPAAAPTHPMPETRGFRIASGQPAATTAAATSRPAGPVRGFQIARAVPVASAASTAAATSPAARGPRSSGGRYVATTRARPAPAVGQARADLMLTFELNSDHMTPAGEARARTFAQALMMDELRPKRFLIEGHTDAGGSRTANIDLSRRRAQTVADFLIAQGVDRTRVEVRGVGPDQPLPGHPASAEANRRVEAVLLS